MHKKELIDEIITYGFLKSENIIDAFEKIDRKDFVPKEFIEYAYENQAISIGEDATISQPLTVAFMLEKLNVKKGDKILDVGSGSGWTTALLAYLTGELGSVYGVDINPALVEFAKENIKKYDFKNVNIKLAGEKLGMPKKSPFDKILVSASANELPQELITQLKTNGRMVIPIGHSIFQIDKMDDTKIEKQEFYGFSFVSLK